MTVNVIHPQRCPLDRLGGVSLGTFAREHGPEASLIHPGPAHDRLSVVHRSLTLPRKC
ncbi:hypothetical protein [Deinococcus fonticola]|uniref:hypothetical protein n=1 Tax=Deinococcus fonticola TaxID=2528713 RepID=UPI0014316B74|nr:hypothetical protein [Deinococcus fonticola]